MNHERETYGDAVEHNRKMHEEAHRRARLRNEDDNLNEEKMQEAQHEHAVVSHDMNTYSAAESASASPAPLETLSWGGGDHRFVPQRGESEARVPDGRGGPLFGVDAIVNSGR